MSAKTAKRRGNPERAERRLYYISAKQLASLRQLAKRAGTSQQALVRAGIDLVLAGKPAYQTHGVTPDEIAADKEANAKLNARLARPLSKRAQVALRKLKGWPANGSK